VRPLTFAWIDTPGAPSVNQAFAQGAFADLTPHLSGESLKAYPNLALFPPDIWQRSAFNKKIVGVPRPRLRAIGGLSFRDDWGKKLGNPRPKTTDELLKLMRDFTKGDPDGNGQADTWGLGSQNRALRPQLVELHARGPEPMAHIPAELTDSARIDGANDLQVLWHVALPLSKAALAVVALFYGVGHWNDFFAATLYLSDHAKWPIPLVLRQYVLKGTALAGLSEVDTVPPPQRTVQMAIVVIGTLPILLVYPFLQRYFTKGVLTGAIKG
jgi:hypothetical protein